jgi:hypothetical protein
MASVRNLDLSIRAYNVILTMLESVLARWTRSRSEDMSLLARKIGILRPKTGERRVVRPDP